MKRLLLPITLLVVFSAGSVYLSSCKDDDDPEPRAKVSFAASNQSVNENQGTITVQVQLDRAAPENLVVEYTIGGTATRKTSTNAATADFEITGFLGEVEIPQGETSGSISITILNDSNFEDDETIVLTIDDVDSDRVDLGERLQHTITIVSDDAAVIASFATTTATINESESGLHEIVVQLDKPAPSDITVGYDLGAWFSGNQLIQGMAIDSLSAYENDVPDFYYDYYVDGVSGQLTIPQGATSGAIKLNVYSDFILENDEKIELTLKATSGVSVGTNNKFTLTVKQEDCRIIALIWPEDLDVDMDLFVWAKEPSETNWSLFSLAITEGTDIPEEYTLIPKGVLQGLQSAGITALDFGGTYVYYSGTQNPLSYRVGIIDFINGNFEPEDDMEIVDSEFTLDDINEWETLNDIKPPGDPSWAPMQTWKYNNGVYSDLTGITNPGGRMGAPSAGKFIKNLEQRIAQSPKTLSSLRLKNKRLR